MMCYIALIIGILSFLFILSIYLVTLTTTTYYLFLLQEGAAKVIDDFYLLIYLFIYHLLNT